MLDKWHLPWKGKMYCNLKSCIVLQFMKRQYGPDYRGKYSRLKYLEQFEDLSFPIKMKINVKICNK